ncbi:MAG: leucine-rich repeat domain-containing protein [Muribaculaceae bacterium]|nr:leucine-rich repeat domain-containing protein [Muribaculaceae bacterium]
MKKILLFMLTALTVLPALSATTFDYPYEGQTLSYEMSYTGACVMGQTDSGDLSGDLVIPAEVTYDEKVYPVTEINYSAFKGCTGLTSVTIPESITYIGNEAFQGCTGLTSVTIPESMITIGNNAFQGCAALTSVTIPGNVFVLGTLCFADCSNLKTVVLADGEYELEEWRWDNDDNKYPFAGSPVEHMYIGRPFRPVAISTVKTIEFGGGCKVIDMSSGNWLSLEGITVGNSVTEIADESFTGQYKSGTDLYGNPVYKDRNSLNWVILPESLKKIGSSAFKNCKHLFSVMILSSDCEIGDYAFTGCSYLNKIAATNKEIAQKIDNQCPTNTVLWTIEPGETVDVEKGIIWGANTATAPWVSGKYTGKLVIPEDVTNLSWSRMAECPNITEVILPSKLETIRNQVFLGCSSLQDLTIPNRVSEIGTEVFKNTNLIKGAYPDVLDNPFNEGVEAISYDAYDSLTEEGFVYSRRKDMLYYVPLSVSATFEVPESVTEITRLAFSKCSNLESLILPEGLTTLGDGVWNKCNSIKSITCKGTEPVSANRDLFTNTVYDEATLYVPHGYVSAYSKVIPWRYFNNILEIDDTGVENIVTDNMDEEQDFPCEVYSLQGVKVADSVANLPAGIYIVRQGKSVKKIAMK